ncbi:peptide deformylase [Pseudomonas kurunegalensis]|uniref:peptide deformylase n=1 Tax=Pseudomonas kurunegalensis TaxID=485880 RepID=UPI00257074D6|nr:peptide deformylase [Pseudomonas kurunegalensis]WJD60029.1 peptide deformylase [Pseudomonas kurunegalensis]
MAILGVLQHPDARLSKAARPVQEYDTALEDLVMNMLETMYHHKAIGLSGPQVNVRKQIMVVDLSNNQNEPLVMINPAISAMGRSYSHYDEGCVSIPDFYVPVRRLCSIQINAHDARGKPFSISAEGWLAACIQHEMDHLSGQTLMDHASAKQRSQYRRRAGR